MIHFYSKYDCVRRFDEGNTSTERYRTDFRRDYARLVHSPAFRRLQGKTQLFPGIESDFFRNRLTHSLEVAQIAKSIAIKFNDNLINQGVVDPVDPLGPISLDLVETAGLAHDLGHPPFGHNGEKALDECMKPYGGFEGNAQTLRIMAVLEKKVKSGRNDDVAYGTNDEDRRYGLNPTYRTMAAVLKYDSKIQTRRSKVDKLRKGYYASEANLVKAIKQNMGHSSGEFCTIECSIMDAADDIAYSTYDIEDAFKAGFLNPLDFFSDSRLREKVCKKIYEAIEKYKGNENPDYARISIKRKKSFTESVIEAAYKLFISANVFSIDGNVKKLLQGHSWNADEIVDAASMIISPQTYKNAQYLTSIGYDRTAFTSKMVCRFIGGVELKLDKRKPVFSSAIINDDVFLEIELLKQLAYCSQIMSTRLKVAEYRGLEIVTEIFTALDKSTGYSLLPNDFQKDYLAASKKATKKRVICDFIAGMTDRYAIDFYARLKSVNAESIFKPL